MSFALTTPQVMDETKTETRRLGWEHLQPGDLFWAVKKAMGLKPGEQIERLKLCRVVTNQRERLDAISSEAVKREGFPDTTPAAFVAMFCKHMGTYPRKVVTVIRFEYVFQCDMCGNVAPKGTGELKGICSLCSANLGGGKHSAVIVREEKRSMRKERSA